MQIFILIVLPAVRWGSSLFAGPQFVVKARITPDLLELAAAPLCPVFH